MGERRGPWDLEPNWKAFCYLRMLGIIVRHPSAGHLCGYVVIPNKYLRSGTELPEERFEVHGGVTFCDRFGQLRVQKDFTDDVFTPDSLTLGFDCAHLGDLSPYEEMRTHLSITMGTVYRDMDYVTNEVLHLIEQVWEKILEDVVGE